MSADFIELGTVCKLNPRVPKGIDENQVVSFLGMSNVSEGGIIASEETRIFSETRKGFTYFEKGDVLLAKITPCFENGKAVHTSELKHSVGFGSTEFHVIRPETERADPKYIFYMIWNSGFRYIGEAAMKGAAGQKRVSKDFIEKFKIPLPPLAEQKQIAAILDAADSLRQKDQQLVEHYTKLSQSLFLEIFGDPVTNPMGWDKKTIEKALIDKDILGIQDGNHGEKHPKASDFVDKGIPFIMANCLNDGNLNLKKAYKLNKQWLNDLRIGFTLEGDVLLSHKGTIGEVAIVSSDDGQLILSPQVTYYRLGNSLLSTFLKYQFSSSVYQQFLIKEAKQSTRAYIGITRQKKLSIILPPSELQNQFAERVEKIEQQKQQAQINLAKSNDLFNALLQKAFTGELTANQAA